MISFEVPEYHNPAKHFVAVKALFEPDGNITPLAIICNDEAFEVDRITDIRPAASLKSGGAGIRYTCSIAGRQTYLFLEDTRWFIEWN